MSQIDIALVNEICQKAATADGLKLFLEDIQNDLEVHKEPRFTKEIMHVVSSIKARKLRCIATSGSFTMTEDVLASDLSNVKNCLPFESCLIFYDEPFVQKQSDSSGLQVICVMAYSYFYEMSPDNYFCITGGFRLTNKSEVSERIHYETIVSFEDCLKYIRDIQTQIRLTSKTDGYCLPFPFVSLMHVNCILSKSKRENYRCLENVSTGKLQCKPANKRKLGIPVYIDDILYIGTKTQLSQSKFSKCIERSKPSFASEIMGHWRRLPGRCVIGHDRQSKEILDWTWVKSHIRGEGDIKIKSRRLIENENN